MYFNPRALNSSCGMRMLLTLSLKDLNRVIAWWNLPALAALPALPALAVLLSVGWSRNDARRCARLPTVGE